MLRLLVSIAGVNIGVFLVFVFVWCFLCVLGDLLCVLGDFLGVFGIFLCVFWVTRPVLVLFQTWQSLENAFAV